MIRAHCYSKKECLEKINSFAEGLSKEDVKARIQKFGRNELQAAKPKTVISMIMNQFKDFMIWVLIFAAILSGAMGDLTDAVVILLIVFLNGGMGLFQEFRAEKAVEALKKLEANFCDVWREGHVTRVNAKELVPGDVVILSAGMTVPADLRLMETHSFFVNESALTGESQTVEKDSEWQGLEKTILAERKNMVFKGTHVTMGRGQGLVISTGMNTELGKIAGLLQKEEPPTPLQVRMTAFGKRLSYVILTICIVFLGVGVLRGESLFNMIMISLSLAVAAIPEALPALISIALALGARRLAKKNALMRKLSAVEALGSVSVICSDKTGTLTLNKMEVVRSKWFLDEDVDHFHQFGSFDSLKDTGPAALVLALSHDVAKESETWLGDPTEVALVDHIYNKMGRQLYFDLHSSASRTREVPFDSTRKRMTTVHRFLDRHWVLTKGAPEAIAKILRHSDQGEEMLKTAEEWSSEGMRVIALAYKQENGSSAEVLSYEELESQLQLAGLVGMMDPPRPEIKESVRECKDAGIKVMMITGDHPKTAFAIAKQVGIANALDQMESVVLTGQELDQMNENEWKHRLAEVSVLARVSPEQKLKAVKVLQSLGQYVAMTGDGVNDAPSLKASNIGIAMGINGTDVTKEAAHMILLDDQFQTIVRAVREGRRIFDNIQKFIKYILTCNSAEIWTLFLAPFLGLPIPLLPIHILWINLVTDGLPGLALARETGEENIMKRAPRRHSESLLGRQVSIHIVWVGLFMAGVTLGVQAWALKNNLGHWQTMVFTVLSFAQLAHVFAVRSGKFFLFNRDFFRNQSIFLAIGVTAVLQLFVTYTPFGNRMLKTTPLTAQELGICLGAGMLIFIAVELEKVVLKSTSSAAR